MSRCFNGGRPGLEAVAGQGFQAGPCIELQPEGEEEPIRQKCGGKPLDRETSEDKGLGQKQIGWNKT